MHRLICILTLLAAPAMAQSELPLPKLFTVTGVAENDTLNVRAAPAASAADIGDVQPAGTVEVLRLSEDGKWGRVSIGEAAGWVSMRFLRQTPQTVGRSPDLPYGMPAEMECSGTEPFWGLRVRTGQYVQSDGNSALGAPEVFPMTGAATVSNRSLDHFAFSAPPQAGFITRQMCDDGMSEAEFGWSLYLLWQGENGLSLLQGCCTALQP